MKAVETIKSALKRKKSLKKSKEKWGNVQFFHAMGSYRAPFLKRYTVALDIPSKKSLLGLQNTLFNSSRYDHPNFVLGIGISRVNPKDQYTKSIGRQLSFERIKPVEFFLNQVTYEGGRAVFNITGLGDGSKISLNLSINPGSNKAQFNLAHLTPLTPRALKVAKGKIDDELEPLPPRVHVCGINEDGTEDLR